MPVWSADQVLALASDAASAASGRGLSSATSWSGTGADARAVWGLCQGSGKNPYRTVVDVEGPAFRCSCPSRKFPCKHALGLLLLWSAGGVGGGEAPEWAASWLDERATRAAGGAAGGAAPAKAAKPPDPEAAAKRARQRAERVAGGIEELDTWLLDQVRNGLAGLERGAYAAFDGVAARMVDAQAATLASRLRALPGTVASGEGWPGRLLEDLAMLRLTVQGHRRLGSLPEALAACVRREVGYTVAREDVLASPPVRDRWQVLALRDVEEERFVTRRVWLLGERSGRVAMVLSFGPSASALDVTLLPGWTLDADLHYYPGAAPLRAVVGERYGEPLALSPPRGGGLDDAAAAFAAAVAADPWVRSWPVVVEELTPVPGSETPGRRPAPGEQPFRGVDRAGRAVALTPPYDPLYRLLAVSGGHPVTVTGEWTPDGLRPLSVHDDGRLVVL